jgi:DNA-binding PadR family transcriptional regulator
MDTNRTKSAVPRGFSRFYVLFLLKERPMTGKEIMDETERRSNGAWKPSPGLVYPLLGRLLAEGLISENSGGGYVITPGGEKALEQYSSTDQGFGQVYDTLLRLGVFGRLVAQDITERMISLANTMRQDLSKMTASQRARYREFLKSELDRMERDDKAGGAKASSPPLS